MTPPAGATDPGSPAGQRAARRSARAGRRALIEAEDFTRARSVAALERADPLALEDVARHPHAALAAGAVVALLVAAATAAGAFLSQRAPSGWEGDDTLVLDASTGARYLVLDRVLHPAPTLTGAVLAGARGTPVRVPHRVLRDAAVGAPLAGADLPESPPVVPARPAALLACTSRATGDDPGTGTAAVQVWSGRVRTTTSGADGLLVRAPGSSDVLLVTGSAAFPITAAAAEDLGYSSAQVRTVPAAWLALLPRGVALAPLALPAAGGSGVAGVGASGDVVTVAGSQQRLLVEGGQLHPFLNRTSELLAPAPVREVSGAALASAARGDAVGLLQAPSTPPRVPAREAAVSGCATPGGAVSVATAVRAPALRASAASALAGGSAGADVVWHQRTGAGALVGPVGVGREDTAADGTDPSSARGARVVSGGTAYPLADQRALDALGWTREQALPLPAAWLALAAGGPALRAAG